MFPDGDDINDPVVKCPYLMSGQLLIEVVKYRAATPNAPKKPLGGVKGTVTGATKKVPQLTTKGGDGRATSGKLTTGSHTVTLEFTDKMKETLDLDNAITTRSKDVKKRKTTPFVFQIPYNWVEYEVKYENDTWAPGFQLVFRRKKKTPLGLEASWTVMLEGKSVEATAKEEEVPAGKYQLELKLLFAPKWSADRVVADDAIDLVASASGFDVGAAGTIEILDASDYTTVVHTLNPQVANDLGESVLKSSWTPAKGQFTNLKGGSVVFRAKIGPYLCVSDPRPVFYKEPLELKDDAGKKLTAKVKLRFSGGHTAEEDVAGGKADVLWPWAQKLTRIDLPEHKGKRFELDSDGVSTRTLSMAN